MKPYHPTALLVLVLAACSGGDNADDAPPAEPPPPAVQQVAAVDTTPEALWAHLEQSSYKSWPMFPGKGQLYKGMEPHGSLLTTYVNQLAQDAITNGAATLPPGSIIVKENYMPDSTYAAATVMYKVAGYDAANGDWYWAKYVADGSIEASGRVAMCAQCHTANKQRDYVMTALPPR